VLLVFIWRSVAKPFFTNLICKLRNESSSTFKKQSIYVFMSRTDTRIIVKYIVYSGIAIVTLYSKYLFEVFNV
jgi:dihydrosphingosine 1-phosphate phosphatase